MTDGYIIIDFKILLERYGGHVQIKFKDDEIRHKFYQDFQSRGLHGGQYIFADDVIEIVRHQPKNMSGH
jgi:hypothetical protein